MRAFTKFATYCLARGPRRGASNPRYSLFQLFTDRELLSRAVEQLELEATLAQTAPRPPLSDSRTPPVARQRPPLAPPASDRRSTRSSSKRRD